MFRLLGLSVFVISLFSCVPAKKYQELLSNSEQCDKELAAYKKQSLTDQAANKDLQTKRDYLEKEYNSTKKDFESLMNRYNLLNSKYEKLVAINESLETNYDKLRLSGAKETAVLNGELEAKQLELQQREDEVMKMEKLVASRERRIKAQEEKLAELNERLAQQEAATAALKERVSKALRSFEKQGLTVEEKDGKIYVSLEAKLLFNSGSTTVEPSGKRALVELAKVLETEKDLEIIVEGHTDTDPLNSASHPSDNWELSVLRSTSVINIMLANSNMDPQQIMAAGRSEFHPVDESNKAKNRRIEVIISPDLDALYQIISE